MKKYTIGQVANEMRILKKKYPYHAFRLVYFGKVAKIECLATGSWHVFGENDKFVYEVEE